MLSTSRTEVERHVSARETITVPAGREVIGTTGTEFATPEDDRICDNRGGRTDMEIKCLFRVQLIALTGSNLIQDLSHYQSSAVASPNLSTSRDEHNLLQHNQT